MHFVGIDLAWGPVNPSGIAVLDNDGGLLYVGAAGTDGEIIDAAYLLDHHTKQIGYEAWRSIASVTDWVCDNWDRPDEGIWETRGGRQRFTHSRLMCWVALDRAIRIAQDRGFPANLARWIATRDQIFHRIMKYSWSESRGAFVQHEQSELLEPLKALNTIWRAQYIFNYAPLTAVEPLVLIGNGDCLRS